jgi:hypothetical protein
MTTTIKNFGTQFTGWTFIAAFALLWIGYLLLPHHIGEYIVAEDFKEIGKGVWYWIWMYRVHIFGWVAMAVAIMAFLSMTSKSPLHVLTIPGGGMIIVGTFTLAIANAFYYNFGADGVGKTMGMTPEEIDNYVNSILSINQYVTCFTRFGRIFSGLGFVIFGAAIVKWGIVNKFFGWFTIVFGLGVMALILLIPDNFELYKPLFHVKAFWLLGLGILILTQGLKLPESSN